MTRANLGPTPKFKVDTSYLIKSYTIMVTKANDSRGYIFCVLTYFSLMMTDSSRQAVMGVTWSSAGTLDCNVL